MKKTLSILLVLTLFVAVFAFSACDNFTNPGDNLGGGKAGEIASPADTTDIDRTKDAIKGKTDLTDIAGNTSAEGAATVEQTLGIAEISKSGTYLFKGNYGGILFTKKELDVHLIFDGVTITCNNGVAIDAQDKKDHNVVITLNAGTVNTVVNDGDDVNAIHVKGSLAINGKGALNVTSNSKSAVKVRDDLCIVDATLSLTAANHAITALSVAAVNCEISVSNAGKDGINAECDGEIDEFTTEQGYVVLKNVNYTCNVSGDGIQANTVVYVEGGAYNITTNGEFIADTADNRTEYGLVAGDFKFIKDGNDYKRIASDDRTSSTKYALAQGCKGIKVSEIEYSYKDDDGEKVEGTVYDGNYLIEIVSGTFTINSTDDAIHTNSGDVLIEGGTYTISTYDDGITSDNLTKISGGNVNITRCYEGVEGCYVEISGGKVNVVSGDDGINAASDNWRADNHIIISGGEVTVNSVGDGIDSNGSILISGGTVIVHGPTTGRDAGLDADKGIVITGGTVFASSTLGMVETPASNSPQYVVSYAQQSSITAGSVVSLRDKKGNVLMEVTVAKSCQSVIMSCAALQNGSTYYIYGNDKQITSFKVSSIITSIGSTGSRFPGGGGPNGGERPRP